MTRLLIALVIAALPAPVVAVQLTVRAGETWMFRIDHGEPVDARKIGATAAPAVGEVKLAVRSLFGTDMTITNNSAQGYTFEAQLIGADGKTVTAHTCTLPPGNLPTLESWPQKAAAIRVGNFKPANGGRC